ncbi:MAG TPA: MgtC/SapB family protein [Chitinophagales bacterium]|nr:MgtC/SapB family protein [Chitinophagales bacterium]
MFDETIISSDLVTLTLKDIALRLAVTLGVGFVIGLEREHAAIRDNEHHFAGVRTFTIVALLGFLSGIVSGFLGIWITFLCLAGLLVLAGVSYYVSSQRGDVGTTTEFTLITSFLLGLLTLLGYVLITLTVTVIILTLLSLKFEMKAIAGRITQEEIFAFLKFVVLAALILPFLPDRTIDPYNVFNPQEIMRVIILTSGLNFSGYLLIKFLGAEKGILLTGIVGGFVSSTIVTWTFSKRSRENPALSKNYSAAIFFASSIMPVRVILWIYIFNAALLARLVVPLILLISAGFVYALILMRNRHERIQEEEILPRNPLNLSEALKFGGLFILILYFVHFAILFLGSKGVLIASAISALSDVDAITISLAKISDPAMSVLTVSNGILLAVLSNTVVKIALALIYGSPELKKRVITGYGLIFLAGIAGFVIVNFI